MAESQEIVVRQRGALIAAVRNATPGTRILIAPGTYDGGLVLDNLHGEASRPIVLTALDPEHPPEIVGGTVGLQLTRPKFVELSHLTIRGAAGNGLNIDDGGDATGSAQHLVLSHLRIHDIGPQGNRDGIKLSGVDDFKVEHCNIERWGESGSGIDMVGCHRGEIQKCQFRFRSELPANGVQTKGGSSEIVIRRCRFINAGSRAVNAGGSTGKPYFRPRDANYEAREITIEDCTFIGSMSPIAFVGVDGATVRYNTIFRPTRWVTRILQESQGAEFVPCRNGVFANNIIAFRSDEVRTFVNVGTGTAADTFRFQANVWYCLDQPSRSARLGLPTMEVDGTYGIEPLFRDTESFDLRLQPDSPIHNAGVRTEDE